MGKIINHGIVDIDFDKLNQLINESKHERSSVYERDTYMKPRQNSEDKEITEKCAEWYKHSSFAVKIKNKKFNDCFPDYFYNKLEMIKETAKATVYKFIPGQFTPPHRDLMGDYISQSDADKKNLTKVWVALSEPELGHALFVGKENVIYNVPKGTTLQFDFQNDWHSGVNAGTKDRYFLTMIGKKING
jgi:hypothetical protein